MKKTFKLNENRIRNIIRETIDELKYNTYKSAYDKMRGLSQDRRASDFEKTFKDIYDDDYTTFDLKNDTVDLRKPVDNSHDDGNWKHVDSEYYKFYNNGDRRKIDNYSGGEYRGTETTPRTSDRKLARKYKNTLDFYYGQDENGKSLNPFDKNDFIAERVLRVIKSRI